MEIKSATQLLTHAYHVFAQTELIRPTYAVVSGGFAAHLLFEHGNAATPVIDVTPGWLAKQYCGMAILVKPLVAQLIVGRYANGPMTFLYNWADASGKDGAVFQLREPYLLE